jgi:ArsR family transcriptional regulator
MTETVEIFKALGDETRLRLINILLQTDDNLCVCEMVDALELPQYQISKHLTILKNAGLLKASREGTWVYYRLDREESPLLRDLFKVLGRHLSQVFVDDAGKLLQRLALREEGRCVVGFIPPQPGKLQGKASGDDMTSKFMRNLTGSPEE